MDNIEADFADHVSYAELWLGESWLKTTITDLDDYAGYPDFADYAEFVNWADYSDYFDYMDNIEADFADHVSYAELWLGESWLKTTITDLVSLCRPTIFMAQPAEGWPFDYAARLSTISCSCLM